MLDSLPGGGSAVVIGAGGAIGAALAAACSASHRFAKVYGFSRRVTPGVAGVSAGYLDLEIEASIAAAAAVVSAGPPPRLLVIATGILHGPGFGPEKSIRAMDGATMLKVLAVNTVGPALVAKHFTPLIPREGKAVFAALSARVGSIGDNRLGGWHSYRTSKAALHMLIRTLSIELERSRPGTVCLSLHPGTVESGLSAPFQANVRPERLFQPEFAAGRLLAVMDARQPGDSGGAYDWDNQPIAW
jgi:NAD(P)-dependent dehydrogenase (short-subunit alcohol dehydrogenase family)